MTEGRKAMVTRLLELKWADEDSVAEQFLEAESTIEQYLDAVAERSASLPDPQEIAFACLVLLATLETLREQDLELLGRLNAPSLGVSLYAVSQQIAEMKVRAITLLEQLNKNRHGSTNGGLVHTLLDDDVPF